jgi:hypothetical protein
MWTPSSACGNDASTVADAQLKCDDDIIVVPCEELSVKLGRRPADQFYAQSRHLVLERVYLALLHRGGCARVEQRRVNACARRRRCALEQSAGPRRCTETMAAENDPPRQAARLTRDALVRFAFKDRHQARRRARAGNLFERAGQETELAPKLVEYRRAPPNEAT